MFYYLRISFFFCRIASVAAQAGQSQYFAPDDLISLACFAMLFAVFAPKQFTPLSDSAKLIKLSIG